MSAQLPGHVRERLFDTVVDLINKHHLPVQNMSGLTGVPEAGDICGDVERAVIIWQRASRVAVPTVHELNEDGGMWFVQGESDRERAAASVSLWLLQTVGYSASRHQIFDLLAASYKYRDDWSWVPVNPEHPEDEKYLVYGPDVHRDAVRFEGTMVKL